MDRLLHRSVQSHSLLKMDKEYLLRDVQALNDKAPTYCCGNVQRALCGVDATHRATWHADAPCHVAGAPRAACPRTDGASPARPGWCAHRKGDRLRASVRGRSDVLGAALRLAGAVPQVQRTQSMHEQLERKADDLKHKKKKLREEVETLRHKQVFPVRAGYVGVGK